jgi:Ion channel
MTEKISSGKPASAIKRWSPAWWLIIGGWLTLFILVVLVLLLMFFGDALSNRRALQITYLYTGILAVASSAFALVMVRLIARPEPRDRYCCPKLADWWPVPHFIALIAYVVALVNAFAFAYWIVALADKDALKLPGDECISYGTALYYSITTFTTTGYGDITPGPALRLAAAAEMLVGYTIFGLFVAVFYQLLTRPSATSRTTRAPRRQSEDAGSTPAVEPITPTSGGA